MRNLSWPLAVEEEGQEEKANLYILVGWCRVCERILEEDQEEEECDKEMRASTRG